MQVKEIKQYLCYYFINSAELLKAGEYTEKELNEKRNNPDCMCDNCFYGRTKLAKEILKLKGIDI